MSIRWRQRERGATRSIAKRALAVISALALGLSAMVAGGTAAQALPPGIAIDVLHDGQVVGDGAVIPEGDEFLLRVQYDAGQPIDGTVIDFTLPDNVTAPATLPGNEAIESIVNNGDGTVTVTFKNPIPDDISEGAFALLLKAGAVDENEPAPISWKVGEDEGGVTITVGDNTPPPAEIEDSYNKGVNPNNLDRFVRIGEAPDYEFLGLDPAIADQVLTYTLVLGSAEARSGYSIEDQLAAGLGFVPNSFDATLTTAEGTTPFAFAPTVAGNSFSGTVDVPAQSTLRITYQVRVTDVAAFEELLREKYEARNNTPGNYEILIPNKAVFGGEHERSVNVRLRGNIPGVGIGENFNKTGNWSLRDVIADADGKLQPAAEMTYTLRANLTPWDGRNANFTLNHNVVISDHLIEQASWKTGDDGFITVSGAGPIQGLTLANGFSGTAADFAADQYVGQYALVGNLLLINVGKDNTTNVSIQVKAQLDTVAGLDGTDNTTVVDGTHYPWHNRAQFHYRDGDPANRDHNAGVVVLPEDYEEGVNDSAAFKKTSGSDEIQAKPGERAVVPYRFTIDTRKEQIDPLKSKIIDEIKTDVFDVSDLSSILASSTYSGTQLTAADYAIGLDGSNLVIELSEAGKAKVAALPEGEWIIDINLTTVPFDGKETFEIYNRATLVGEDSNWDYWDDDEAEATSYGNEAELRKRVFDTETGEWVESVEALIEGGEFVDDRFVYAIELIPRGNYGEDFPVKIFTRDDVLPDSVEFLGFVGVDEAGAPILDPMNEGPDDMNGNIVASYEDGVVTIRQKDGTNLNPKDGRIITYFAVRANDASENIVNSIAGSDATIKPVGDPDVDIEKWNAEGDEAPRYEEGTGKLLNDEQYAGDHDDAPGKALRAGEPLPISFTVSNDGREDLVDVSVSDELSGGKGEIEDLSCDFSPLGGPASGKTWDGPFKVGTQFDCTGTLPALTNGDTHFDTAKVTAKGIKSGKKVEDEDEWHAWVPKPGIDIEKWNDEGAEPEYDASGALQNDGFDGDFDEARGKQLQAGERLPIHFTISNDGQEALTGVSVSDELTGGKGEIEDLSCDFSPLGGPESGTAWDGPFKVGDRFECTGTLPALAGGDFHSDTAKVVGVGIHSGTEVADDDDWHGTVPVPGVDIEKWSDEGEKPEYDEAGNLVNDGYQGDFDTGKGKQLTVGKDQRINFTVSNNGGEPLVDLVVNDKLVDGKGHITDLVCTFPDGSKGTTWSGPFEVGSQFDCSGTLPGLKPGEKHVDTADVAGWGLYSGIGVDDADDWKGYTDEDDVEPPLAITGGQLSWMIAVALLLLGAGGAALIARRRAGAAAE